MATHSNLCWRKKSEEKLKLLKLPGARSFIWRWRHAKVTPSAGVSCVRGDDALRRKTKTKLDYAATTLEVWFDLTPPKSWKGWTRFNVRAWRHKQHLRATSTVRAHYGARFPPHHTSTLITFATSATQLRQLTTRANARVRRWQRLWWPPVIASSRSAWFIYLVGNGKAASLAFNPSTAFQIVPQPPRPNAHSHRRPLIYQNRWCETKASSFEFFTNKTTKTLWFFFVNF